MVGWKVVSPSSCYPPPGTFPLPLHAFPILSNKGGHHSDAAWSLVKWFITHTWTLPLVNSKYSIGLVGSSTSRVLSSLPTTIPRNTPIMHLMASQDSSQRCGCVTNSSSSCCFSGSKVLCYLFFHHLPQIWSYAQNTYLGHPGPIFSWSLENEPLTKTILNFSVMLPFHLYPSHHSIQYI